MTTALYPIQILGAPPHSGKNRGNEPYERNATASYAPKAANGFPKVTQEVLNSFKDDIENHFERRCQVYLLQLLLVHRSGLQFFKTGAEYQVGKGEKKYHACHVATIPTLLCSRGNSEKIVFGKCGLLYKVFNETTLLPVDVNKIDSRIDLHNRKLKAVSAMRGISIAILNKASTAYAESPKINLLAYLEDMLTLVQRAFEVDKSNENQLIILGCYLKVAESYKQQLLNSDKIIKFLTDRPKAEQIGPEYYSDIQKELYNRFFGPSASNQSIPLPPPLFPALPPLPAIRLPGRSEEEKKTMPVLASDSLDGSALKYKKICEKAEEIKTLVKDYFSTVSEAERTADRKILSKLKSSKTANKKCKNWSVKMREIYDACLKAIQTAHKGVDPQKMDRIVGSLLDENSILHAGKF